MDANFHFLAFPQGFHHSNGSRVINRVIAVSTMTLAGKKVVTSRHPLLMLFMG